jgi:protein-disulfide isomerase
MSRINIVLGTSVIMVLIGYLIIQFNPVLNLKTDPVADLNIVNNSQITNNMESKNLINVSGIVIEDIVLGDPNAPVTIIEYASFTCPHCKNFHEGTFKKLKKNYIDEGKVKFILRDVFFDRYGLWAAMVARCGNSEKFYGIVEEIFRRQAEWTKGEEDIQIANNLRKIGLSIGMDSDTIGECLSDGEMAQALVNEYQKNAEKDKISSTPSFLINGEKIKKSSYDEFVNKIEEHLKGY